ncbi:AAA domain-containing protein [Arcobacter sp. YIC-464]|uniref:AAA domain-containing protein n=1 Tax=Arcobacter sp. YIC-464 TaxID=3376631 RepID=UPI003C2820F3
MLKSYELIKKIKDNVLLVKNLKDEQLIVKVYPKNSNEYSTIYLHEIKALEKLLHQNVVKIEKSEEDEDNYYLLFKFIHGETISSAFRNLNNDREKYNFLKTINKILDALNYIHLNNYTHNDIKPNNIIVNYNNEPYILDFGTATISNTITKSVSELSLWYASPEQKNNLDVDLRSDFYSLGVTIIETLVEKQLFNKFIEKKISIEELIDSITFFTDGKNEELKNILKQMTYEDRNHRFDNAKEIITRINNILSFFNFENEYELNLSETVKKQLIEDYNKSPWDVLEFINEKLNNEIKYVEYGKDQEDRDQVKICTKDLVFYCGIKSNDHFYVFRYSQRVPDSIKQNGHILEDKFILSEGHPLSKYNLTDELIDKLIRLDKKETKEKEERKEKKDFLTKTEQQLKIERAILDKKNIFLYAYTENIKKAKKEFTAKVINQSNIKIRKEHLKSTIEEKFIHQLFNDGFIDDPNNQDLVELLNSLIENFFFEYSKNDIAKKLSIMQKKKKEDVKKKLISNYEEIETNMKKLKFNAELLFFMYPEYLIKQKEEDDFFEQNDDVIVEGLNKKNKFNSQCYVQNISVIKKEINLKHDKEISKIPDEIKISFDYARSSGVLNKQEYSIKDLKSNSTIIDNLLGKISNPNSLAPKREIPKIDIDFLVNKRLDENQKEAVEKALSLEMGEYLVIQGPPGTGKTTVITEIIQQILKRNKLAKILVTSQSNQAVDNVLEKICENENKIVRFGNDKSKFSDTALKYHEESVFYSYLQEVKKRLDNDNTNYFLKGEQLDSLHKRWRNTILQGDDELKTLLFKKIRVIFGTLVGISSWQDFRSIEFDYIIVDEAGRATLPELMIPLRKAKKFILVGDHNQLPPIVDNTVLSKMIDYNKKDLETTLFEELYKKIEHNDFKHFLKYNYRSHSSIAKLYSEVFYDGNIETKDDLVREHQLDFEKKVYFYSTSNIEGRFEKHKGNGNITNNTNKKVIINILKELQLNAIKYDKYKSVGIITPYLTQRDNLQSSIGQMKSKFDKLDIDINSVDAFQGSDRDIIIYDMVRSKSNSKVNIEFIADEKRLNVALSRTKELLFLVGDANFIYSCNSKEGNNPCKKIIELISQDKDYYEIKEVTDE